MKFLVEECHEGLDTLIVEKNSNEDQKIFITGPFMMAEKKNQNGRIYKLEEMIKEANRYTSDMIRTRRAIGEMNHPQSIEVNPVNACHLITELKQQGNYFVGKSQVLNTPMGKLLQSLIKDNVQMGISTRGLGNIAESSDTKHVSDFHLICLDVVHQPSVKDAMLDSVMENREWVIGNDGRIFECINNMYEQLDSAVTKLPKHDKDNFLRESLLKFIQTLKTI